MKMKSQKEHAAIRHTYRFKADCMICTKCGTAKHKTKFEGFKYWFAGVGYDNEPPCRELN